MKTDELIRALAADTTLSPSVERVLARAMLPTAAVIAALFVATMGWRADLALVATDLRFLTKFVLTITLAGTAALLACRLARPASDTSYALIALAAAPVLLGFAVVMELAVLEPGMRAAKAVGATWATCLTFIPLLSAPILIASLIALRHGATTRPALAGAVAGLLAGGVGATIYAIYCVEDSALFFLTWYTLAIAIVTAAGAIAGARVLRW